ncbi:MAG: PEGA domain-containing protein [Bacteroidota bacterium]
MKKLTENRLGRIKRVKDLLSANMLHFAAFPALMDIINLFFAKTAELFSILGKIELSLTGYAKDKGHIRTRAIDATLRLSGVIESYADSVSNDVLFDKVHASESTLIRIRDDELGIHFQSLLEIGNEYSGDLIPYGFQPVDLSNYSALVTEYNDWTQRPSEARTHRHELGVQAEGLLRELETLMRRRMDGPMFTLNATEPLFFAEYKASRRMIRTGSRKRKTAEETTSGYLNVSVRSATDNVIIEGAKVYVDRELIEETDDDGETQDKLLTEGVHSVKVEAEGYVTYEGSVNIEKGEELIHEVILELKAVTPASEDETTGE